MERNSFVFKKAWRDAICELPEKVRAEVYVAIIEYGITGEAPELKSMARVAFAFVKADIDRDNEAELRKAAVGERMRELAGRRWDKRQAPHPDETEPDSADAPAYAPADAPADATAYAPADATKKPSPIGNVIIKEDNIKKEEDNIFPKINTKNKERERGKKEEGARPPNTLPASDTEQRKRAFYASLVPYVGKYGKAMIRSFFDYWTETNRSGAKMRYELERTWKTPLRLSRWAARENDFKGMRNGKDNSYDKVRQREDDALAIMRELRGNNDAGQMGEH